MNFKKGDKVYWYVQGQTRFGIIEEMHLVYADVCNEQGEHRQHHLTDLHLLVELQQPQDSKIMGYEIGTEVSWELDENNVLHGRINKVTPPAPTITNNGVDELTYFAGLAMSNLFKSDTLSNGNGAHIAKEAWEMARLMMKGK